VFKIEFLVANVYQNTSKSLL